MNTVKKEACVALKIIIFRNNKYSDYVDIVENVLHKFQVLVCSTSLKIHFLNSSRLFSKKFKHRLGRRRTLTSKY